MTRKLMLVLALSAVAGCGDTPTGAGVVPTSGPNLSIYDPSTLTLGVSFAGINKYLEAGPAQLTATVTGGTAPYRYYWFAQACSTGSSCGSMYLKSSGEGLSTASGIYVYGDDAFVRVKLIVADASGETWTGDYVKTLIGPAATFGTLNPSTCWGGNDPSMGYPFFTAVPPNPVQQTGNYRIDACTHARIWEPKPTGD